MQLGRGTVYVLADCRPDGLLYVSPIHTPCLALTEHRPHAT